MFDFSSKTLVNKEFKISDVLTQIKSSKQVKEDAKKISKIIFQNVINSNSINCPEDEIYKNIYIIRISVKERNIPKLFIKELDKNILFHTFYIFEFNGEIASMMAFKEIVSKVKINSKYYLMPFKKEELVIVPLVSNIMEAYTFLLAYQIGIKARKNESPNLYITRVKAINKLKFQISKTENGIKYETQPKNKFEYNERLRKYKKNIEELKRVEE